MPLPGGAADKYGNRYEGRWTTVCMTDVLNETACSIRLEPPGDEGSGVEFWLKKTDRMEYHQVKRQTSSSGYWTISKLGGKHILQNFYKKLRANESNICFFVSTQDVYILSELVDRARRAASFDEFITEFLKVEKYLESFNEICQIWNECSKIEAFKFLSRIFIKTVDEFTLKNNIIIDRIKPLIDGDPATIADVLAQFALDEVNKELRAYEIWNHLKKRGFKQCNWSKDPLVLAAVEECTYRSLPKFYEGTISGKVIPRDETQIILDKLKIKDKKKKGILISGEAGVGKSGVLLQVVESLRKQGKPLLVFRADRLRPTTLPNDVGRQLEMPASPANVLQSIALGHDCVLVIDQLDSVSQTSGRNPWFFDCIFEIIEQALNYPEMHILLACRKFDLENDYRLRSLIGERGIADDVPIKRLPYELINKFIKNELSLDITRLNKKQLDLLSIPMHLSLLAEISQDHEIDAINFKTLKDLYDRFWDRKGRILRHRYEDSSRWIEVIFTMSDYMSNHQLLSAPTSILDKFASIPDYLASEHILIKDGNKFAFFHQGFFDYVFARNFYAQGGQMVPFLKKVEQHLFRRSQVRQILLHERDDDFERYIHDLESLLNDPEIRFHLKKIVFALLSELTDPTNEEWKIIEPFLINLADPRSNEVKYVLFGSIYWINLLKTKGQLANWLADVNEENINLAIMLLSKIQKEQPEVVIDLIEPYLEKNQMFCQIFKTSKIDACESFFKLVLQAVDRGIVDDIEELDPLKGHFWYAQKDFLKDHPEWACEFLSHYLNKKYIICLLRGQPNPFDREKGCIPDHVRDEEIANSIKECAEKSPEAFIHELLPFILRLVGFNAYTDNEIINSPFFDNIWRNRYYYDGYGIYIDVCILSSMEVAMTSLAKTKPGNFRIIAEELKDLDFETIHYLLIRGYAANGEQFANDAVNYLIKYPVCLETGYVEDKFKAAIELLEAITPYCSNEQLAKIESIIIERYSNIEDREEAQFKLYNGINLSRRSESVNTRLHEMTKKYGLPFEEPPKRFVCGPVVSPISEQIADKMSDGDWLQAILSYNSESRPFTFDGTDILGGAYELSLVLEKQVKWNPSRFAALIQKFPDDSNVHYFNAILRGIADTDLNIKLALDVCRRCHNLQNKPCGMWICDVIAKIAKNDLPNEALDIVAWYATEDPDPEYEKWRPEGPNKTIYYGGDIINAGLNSVRGRAADAMATLVFYDKARLTYLKNAIEKLVADSSIEVRSWVALILIYIFIYDEDRAERLFLDLCKTEDILLSTHHVEKFLSYALRKHFSQLEPILKRMMISQEAEVVKAGARRICIASFDIEESRTMMESCMSGTENQRLGAAEVFSSNIKIFPGLCTSKMIKLFYDDNEQVREQAASCFKQLIGEDLVKFRDLIEAFIESPSFDTKVGDLVWALDRTNARLPELTYRVCKKFIDSTILANNRNFSLEMDVSQLIIRLYSQDEESSMGAKCLDLIDIMIENDVYRIDKELFNYER